MGDQGPLQFQYTLLRDCVCQYEAVLEDLAAGKLLPKVGLTVLQHHLYSQVYGSSIPSSFEYSDPQMAVQGMAEARLSCLKAERFTILVTGEYNAGKSSFLNILMGGDYLPVNRGKVTKVVCEIQNDTTRSATLRFSDDTKEIQMALQTDAEDKNWATLREYIKNPDCMGISLKRIIIRWPFPYLQDPRFFVNPLSTAPNRTADKVEIPRSTSIAASSGGEVAGSGFLDVGTRRTSGYQGSPGGNVVGSVGSSFLQVEGNNRSPFLRVGHNVSAVDDVDNDVDRALTSAIFPQQHPANVSMTSQNETTSVKRVYSPFSDSSTSSSDTSYMSFTPSSLSDSYSMNDSTVSSSQTWTVPVPVTFVDCPGVDENHMISSVQTILDELNQSNAFIFLVDTIDKELGIRKQGILELLRQMSGKLAQRGMIFNTQTSLFIANKIDDYDAKIAEQEIFEKLKQALPVVTGEQIISTTAKRVLKKMNKGKMAYRNRVYEDTCGFLKRAYAAMIEDHLTWLVRITETATLIGRVQNLPLTANLRAKLQEDRARAVALQNIDVDKAAKEDRLIDNTVENIYKILRDAKGEIDKINWEPCWITKIGENHREYRLEDKRAWEETFSQLDEIIMEEIFAVEEIQHEITKVNKEFAEQLLEIYRAEIKTLESLRAEFSGPQGVDEKNNTVLQMLNVVAPAVLGATFRLSPIGLGAALLLTPVLPLAWLVSSWVEEWSDYQYRSKMEEFKTNKDDFVRNELSDLLEKGKGKISRMSHLLETVGKKKKVEIHEESVKLISLIDFLLGTASSSTDMQKETTRRHFSAILEIYLRTYLGNFPVSRYGPDGAKLPSGSFGPSLELGSSEEDGVHEFQIGIRTDVRNRCLTVEECVLLRHMSLGREDRLARLLHSHVTSATDGLSTFKLALENGSHSLTWVVSKQPADQGVRTREFVHYAQECCECVKVLHDMNLVHGDINPANFILVNFGDGDQGCNRLKITILGRRQNGKNSSYSAPELSANRIGVSKSADIYNLGLVFMELWFRQPIENVKLKGKNNYRTPENDSVSRLVKLCMFNNPHHRPRAEGLLEDIKRLNL